MYFFVTAQETWSISNKIDISLKQISNCAKHAARQITEELKSL